ncbi:hypothetical protein LCGC14_0671150 [marine sediment metagenome]|uniref:Uncharacterized protein n=1 Tax=marine sediment metagenome TaxID=412755 RepID=A0A0F9QQW0_9ZZZZ
MSVEIPVRRIALDAASENPLAKGYILEFIVVDAFTIHTMLLTDKDPTLVATDFINIASEDFHRGGEIDKDSGEIVEGSLEEFGEFAGRIYTESVEWAIAEIVEFNEANMLVEALAAILPPPMDR